MENTGSQGNNQGYEIQRTLEQDTKTDNNPCNYQDLKYVELISDQSRSINHNEAERYFERRKLGLRE